MATYSDSAQRELDQASGRDLDRLEYRRSLGLPIGHQNDEPPPINHTAVTNILARAHAALRTVDCNIIMDAAESVAAQRVSDAILAIEEFARERGMTLLSPYGKE